MRKFVLSICAVLLLSVQFVLAQSQVKGVVTDAEGLPMTGVSVIVKGTNTGEVTDNTGNYAISVPSDGVLVFSFLGYESKEMPVGSRSVIDVQMTPTSMSIDDVVVVGYGSGRKIGTVVGSVAKVSADKLEGKATMSVMDAMQGQVAGLNVTTGSGEPDAVATFRLHGVGSINADKEPLVILDGAPVTTGTLLAMNPYDIESINVLKDASATSIYGSRAANGVIYVASKRGRRMEDVTVNFRTQYAMSNVVDTKLDPMSSEQLIDYTEALYGPQDFFEEYRTYGDTDWFDEIFRKNAPMVQTELSVQGGGEKTSFLFSGSYSDQEGVMPGSEMTRYTFRANVETQATKWLKTGVNLGVGYHKSANTFDVEALGGMWTTLPAVGGLLIPHYQVARDPETGELLDILMEAGGAPSPLTMDVIFPTSKNRLQLNGNMFVEVNPVENLTLRSSLAANAFDYRYTSSTSPDYYWNSGVGSTTELWQRNYNWTLTNTAEYKFRIAPKHNMIVLAGQESLYYDSEAAQVGMKGLTNSNFIYLNTGTELSGIPSYSIKKSTFNSIFGRIDYNFDEKYFLDFSLRDDASSKFSKGNRHATFYAVGAMWNVKKENFLKDSKAFSQLSVKVSMGTSGNSGIGEYDQYATLKPITYNGTPGWALSNAGDPDLKWEKQELLTVGLNTELYSRVRIGVEYYRRTTKDMLMSMPIPATTGFTTKVRNVGSMRNQGVDLTINADLYKDKDWYINLGATFNYNKNEFIKLFNDLDEYAMAENMEIYKIGSAYGTYFMPTWLGVNPDNGYPQWRGANGTVVNNFGQAVYEEQTGKSWIPVYSGGANLTVAWKGISLNANITWEANKWLYNNLLYFSENPGMIDGGTNQTVGALDYWKQPGDHATYPDINLGYPAYQDSHLLESGSFLRLKNITLAWDLPSEWLAKTKVFKGVRVYVSGRNLLTWTNFRGIDPEISGSVAMGDYPNTRQVSFGLDLKF